MKLVLVRHGYSQGNLEGTYSGWTDVELTDTGIKELERYKEEYHYPETDRYFSSDLVRCTHTFEVLFGDEHKLDAKYESLREIFFGDYENLKGDSQTPHFFDGFSLNERTANGETISEFAYRNVSQVEKILKDLKEDNLDSATIVCHSGVIKALLIFLDHRPFSDFRKIDTPNGLGYVLDVDYDEDNNMIKINSVDAIAKK